MEKKRGHMFAGLTAQIRLAMKLAAASRSDGLQKVFEKFDTDGSHMVDKNEFLIGCVSLGVKITKEEVSMMFPYFDLDNSGSIGIEEFVQFAEDHVEATSDHVNLRHHQHAHHTDKFATTASESSFASSSTALRSIGNFPSNATDRRRRSRTGSALGDRQMIHSMAKSQRSRALMGQAGDDRRPSEATDQKVQAIMSKPRWSLTQMRQQVSRLPLPERSTYEEQDWVSDPFFPVPFRAAEEKPKRNWREVVFNQAKCDQQLRSYGGRPSGVSNVQAAAAWGNYREERQMLLVQAKAKEAAKQKQQQNQVAAIEKAAAEIEKAQQAREESGWRQSLDVGRF
jgi:hypothetical protein